MRRWLRQPAPPKEPFLWLSCGHKDGLIRISQGVHASLKEKEVPHAWKVDGHTLDPTEWHHNPCAILQR